MRKDLGASFMASGNIYVAQVAYGANAAQTVKAFAEADYDGPSIIIAYSRCIAHGINMTTATDLHKDAVNTGFGHSIALIHGLMNRKISLTNRRPRSKHRHQHLHQQTGRFHPQTSRPRRRRTS